MIHHNNLGNSKKKKLLEINKSKDEKDDFCCINLIANILLVKLCIALKMVLH